MGVSLLFFELLFSVESINRFRAVKKGTDSSVYPATLLSFSDKKRGYSGSSLLSTS